MTGSQMAYLDEVAKSAMVGMLSCQDFMNDLCKLKPSRDAARRELAELAYLQARAMLQEREAIIEEDKRTREWGDL